MRCSLKRPRLFLIAALVAIALPGRLDAQETPRPTDQPPTIGLTLSGGGAKGFAHLGVLKVLEELRVPVHILTGTSMGSIMGGLYASGMSPDEIQTAMSSVDWAYLFRDLPPRLDLDYRRKEEDQRYLFEIELGIKGEGLAVPSGVVAGQKVGLLLREHSLHAQATTDFDSLPIPYRAIAADIVTGEEVILDHGDLARAMRASMSIPVGLVPVEIDGRLLVDGGVVNNMPVDVAREMGADVVIAVDVSEPLRAPDQIKNMFSIVGQLTGMLTRINVETQIPDADILLDPDLGELGGGDYVRAAEIVAAGEAEARKHIEELRRYSVSEEEYARYRERHRWRPQLPGTIEFVEIDGERRVDERAIRSRITVKPGDPLDVDRIEKDLARVYGTGDFLQVDWTIGIRDGQRGLFVHVLEKPWGPTYLHLGMAFEENGDFTALININKTLLNSRRAEWNSDIVFGTTYGVETEYYQPLDFRGRFFLAPRLRYLATSQDVFDEERDRIAEYDTWRIGGRLDAGVQMGSYGEWRVGLFGERLDAEVGAGAADLPSLETIVAGPQTRFVIDRLDSASFPTLGYGFHTQIRLSREGFGADDGYDRLRMAAAQFWSRGRGTLFGSFNAGSSLGSDLPFHDQFTLGGFLSLSGLENDELRGRYMMVGRLGGYYRLARLPQLIGRGLYLGGWAETGNVWEERRDVGEDLLYTGTVMLGIDTSFGPFYVAYGFSDEGNGEFYVSLGKIFVNPRE